MKKQILFLIFILFITTGCIKKNTTESFEKIKNIDIPTTDIVYGNALNEKTTIENGKEIIEKTYQDGKYQKIIKDGNISEVTTKFNDGFIQKSREEILPDGSRLMIHDDPQGGIHKFIEKDLGNGVKKVLIENKLPDGSIDRIEEIHENQGNGINKISQKFSDGKICEMIFTHDKKINKEEQIITYPDGKIERIVTDYISRPDGSTEVITKKFD